MNRMDKKLKEFIGSSVDEFEKIPTDQLIKIVRELLLNLGDNIVSKEIRDKTSLGLRKYSKDPRTVSGFTREEIEYLVSLQANKKLQTAQG